MSHTRARRGFFMRNKEPVMLTGELLARLQSLWQEGDQLDHATTLRQEKRLNITPDTGKLLYQLVRHQRGGDILEIGTSNGYSTLWMALALRDLTGRIVTLDVSPEKQVLAQQNLQAFAVQDRVQLECRDAGIRLAETPDNSLDLIFLDADRSRYCSYWSDIQRVLRPQGLLIMDNALSHQDECGDFVRLVLASEGYLAETYGIGKGQFVILKD